MSVENANEQVELELEDKETVVEVPNSEEGTEEGTEDQFDKADSATQKRINRLTKKMREAERREVEAISYAKQVQEESQQIKTRMNSLDSHYVNEFSNRVTTQQQQIFHCLEPKRHRYPLLLERLEQECRFQRQRLKQRWHLNL